jgi:hypothetical protein
MRKRGLWERCLPTAWLRLYDSGKRAEASRFVYAFGAELEGHVEGACVFRNTVSLETIQAARRVLGLYRQWNALAKRALLAWGLAAVRLGVPFDVRVMITQLAWDVRSEWSCRL